MPVAELYTDGRIYLDAEHREKELVTQIPGAKWDTKLFRWSLPCSWAACVQLRGVFGDTLQVGEALNAWAGNEIATRIQPCMELRSATDAPELIAMSALRPFQRAGVRFMATAQHCINADDMGLGKTVQAIAAMELRGDSSYPALVICPSSMKYQWAAEIERWAPGRRAVPVIGGAVNRRKIITSVGNTVEDCPIHRAEPVQTKPGAKRVPVCACPPHVIVMNWEQLRYHTRLAKYGSMALSETEKELKELNGLGLRTIIADEAHKAIDPNAKQTRALWAVGDEAEVRYALTGTPVANALDDLWALLRFVAPHEHPGKTAFIERYALKDWGIHGFMQVKGMKPETKDELFKIIDPRIIRRPKELVMPELPPKVYTTRVVEMDTKQRKAYDDMRKHMIAELDNGVLIATNPLVKTTRLTQLASATGTMGDPAFSVFRHSSRIAGPFDTWEEAVAVATVTEESMVVDETPLKLTAPSCKVDALREIIPELGKQKSLIFAVSYQLIELANEALLRDGYRVGMITGNVPEYERHTNVNAFQAGELDHLLITLGAGGEGLTLTAATVEIFLQRSWSAIQNAQAEDRAYGRISDAHGVNIIDVVTKDSIEAKVAEALIRKEEIQQEVLRDADTIRALLSE